MYIPSNIQDCESAGKAWLSAKLEEDELALFDYDRPLKEMPRSPRPFKIISVLRYLLP